MWSRCALRAESASRYPQPGDVKAGLRGSAAFLRALLLLRFCLPVSAAELISMDSAERLRQASGIRPPACPAEALP